VKVLHKHQSVQFVVSDAIGYYPYLPSLLIDRDLDFSNQFTDQFAWNRTDLEKSLGNLPRRAQLQQPIGTALTLAPVFLVAHGLSLVLFALTGSAWFTPTGYTIVYQVLCSAAPMAIGLFGMFLVDDLITRRFRVPGVCTALGVVTYWIGSNYSYYYFREPLMAHTISAFWVIATVWCSDRVLRGVRTAELLPWNCGMLALAVSFALVCRYTNVFLAPVLVYVAWQVVRGVGMRRIALAMPAVAVGITPLIVQLAIWRSLTGKAMHLTAQGAGYGTNERFTFWADPALWQTLFSGRHGLFFWSPVLLLAAWGLIWKMRRAETRRDPLLITLLISAAILWYLNSAWYGWWFGWAFGARAFLELAALFMIGMSFGFEWMSGIGRGARGVVAILLAVAIAYNYSLMALFIAWRIPRGDYPWKPSDRLSQTMRQAQP
ncbi:MAG: hypothetical protein ACREJC_11285, partial [Tepidisphaeraceae bacterium]